MYQIPHVQRGPHIPSAAAGETADALLPSNQPPGRARAELCCAIDRFLACPNREDSRTRAADLATIRVHVATRPGQLATPPDPQWEALIDEATRNADLALMLCTPAMLPSLSASPLRHQVWNAAMMTWGGFEKRPQGACLRLSAQTWRQAAALDSQWPMPVLAGILSTAGLTPPPHFVPWLANSEACPIRGRALIRLVKNLCPRDRTAALLERTLTTAPITDSFEARARLDLLQGVPATALTPRTLGAHSSYKEVIQRQVPSSFQMASTPRREINHWVCELLPAEILAEAPAPALTALLLRRLRPERLTAPVLRRANDAALTYAVLSRVTHAGVLADGIRGRCPPGLTGPDAQLPPTMRAALRSVDVHWVRQAPQILEVLPTSQITGELLAAVPDADLTAEMLSRLPHGLNDWSAILRAPLGSLTLGQLIRRSLYAVVGL